MSRIPTRNFRSAAALACFLLTAAVGLALDLWTKKVAFERLAPDGVEITPEGRAYVRPVKHFPVPPLPGSRTPEERAEAALGIDLAPPAADSPSAAALQGEPGGGSMVARVSPGSLAARAGLYEGDLVVAVDGKPVRDAAHAGELADAAIRRVNGRAGTLAERARGIDFALAGRAGSRTVTVRPDEDVVVERFLPLWLHFQAMTNQGAVFGIGQGKRTLFLVVSVAAIAFITYLFATSGRQRFYQFILGMLLAGVLGNMYDRMLLGYVRDMINIFPSRMVFGREVFPWIFNVADSFLCVGVFLIFVYSLRGAPQPEPDEKADRRDGGDDVTPAADARG